MKALVQNKYGSPDDVLEPVIDRMCPLSEVPEALRYQEEGHVQGKIVITV